MDDGDSASPLLLTKKRFRYGGRFFGGYSGLSIGHLSPEAAADGEIICLVEAGEHSGTARSISFILLVVSEEEVTASA